MPEKNGTARRGCGVFTDTFPDLFPTISAGGAGRKFPNSTDSMDLIFILKGRKTPPTNFYLSVLLTLY